MEEYQSPDNKMYQQVDSIEANKGYTFEEQFKQLYEISDDPKRKEFLDDLFQFMADRNQPVNRIPIMAKQVLDLYELYNLVVARGGLVEVIKNKIWRDITKGLNLPSSITSAAFTLRTQYMKYLYPYECAKNNFSRQEELQQAIDGNRREGRRATGAGGLPGFGSYLAAEHHLGSPNLQLQHLSHLNLQQHLNQNLGLNLNLNNSSSNNNNNSSSNNNNNSSNNNSSNSNINDLSHHLGQQLSNLNDLTNITSGNTTSNPNGLDLAAIAGQPLQLRHEPRGESNASSSLSPGSSSFGQQRLYQDSIQSDHDEHDDNSIDLGHSSKRNTPISNLDHQLESQQQHLEQHLNGMGLNLNLNLANFGRLNQSANDQMSQQLHQRQIAAAAAAIRQQLGAAINFAGTQSFLNQLGGHQQAHIVGSPSPPTSAAPQPPAANPQLNQQQQLINQNLNFNQTNHNISGNNVSSNNNNNSNLNNSTINAKQNNSTSSNIITEAMEGNGIINGSGNTNGTNNRASDLIKQQQEQILAALMAAASQQQNQNGTNPQQDIQAAATRAGLSMMASNAVLISAPNAPEAMSIANAAQAMGVKGAFIILLL